MVECPMPQDILKRKSKFIANLSVREVGCAAIGVGLGALCYFSWCSGLDNGSLKRFLTVLCILPFLLVGFIKIYDQPFEKIAPNIIFDNFICPVKRRKETHFKEFEKYESTRYWIKNPEVEETPSKGKKKKQTPQRIVIEKSDKYKGIK